MVQSRCWAARPIGWCITCASPKPSGRLPGGDGGQRYWQRIWHPNHGHGQPLFWHTRVISCNDQLLKLDLVDCCIHNYLHCHIIGVPLLIVVINHLLTKRRRYVIEELYKIGGL